MNNQSEDRVLGYVGTYPVGDYNEQTEYEYLNVVTHKGSSYVCIKEEGCTAIEPPNEEYWQLFAGKGDTGEKGEKGDTGPIGPKPINGEDYNTEAEQKEFKDKVVADSKADLEKYIAEKETHLDNYTKEKETKLDDYVTDTVKPTIDTYVTDTTKKGIDAYEKEKEKVLDTYTDTKKTEIDNYVTNTSKPALDQYEKDKEAELETAKNTAISEYDAHADSVLTETDDLFNALNTETASGTELYIEDAKPCRIMNTEIGGMYKQETTTGAQLIDYKIIESCSGNTKYTFTNKILEITVTNNTNSNITYNITNAIKNNPGKTLYFNCKSYKFNEGISPKVQLLIKKDNNITYKTIFESSGEKKPYNIPADTSDITSASIRFVTNNTNTVASTKISVTEPIISFVQNAKYEPYTGNIPSPNLDYLQEIEQVEEIKYCITGKNCYDISKFNTNTRMGSFQGHWIYLKENTTYTISTNIVSNPNNGNGLQPMLGNPQNQNAYIVVTTDITASSLTSTNGVGTTNHKARTVTTGETGAIFVGTRAAVTALSDMVSQGGYIQIEEGIVATEYEEYKEQKVNIDLKGNKLCAISDTIKDKLLIDRNGNVALQKNINKYIFTGNENFTLNSTTDRYNEFICVIPNLYSKNYLETKSNKFLYNLDNRISISDTGASYIRIPIKLQVDTIDKFKTIIKDTEAYYALATPELIDLGQLTELQKTFEGINNIWAETNLGNTEIEIEYVQDVKKLLEKQAEQQNARLDNIETLLSTTQTSALLLDNMQSDLESEVK